MLNTWHSKYSTDCAVSPAAEMAFCLRYFVRGRNPLGLIKKEKERKEEELGKPEKTWQKDPFSYTVTGLLPDHCNIDWFCPSASILSVLSTCGTREGETQMQGSLVSVMGFAQSRREGTKLKVRSYSKCAAGGDLNNQQQCQATPFNIHMQICRES